MESGEERRERGTKSQTGGTGTREWNGVGLSALSYGGRAVLGYSFLNATATGAGLPA